MTTGTRLRDYQQRAVANVRAAWDRGQRRVCLVAPTGSGKTTMGAALCADVPLVVWVAHRRELVSQAAARLAGDGLDVGIICPGHDQRPGARVQVGTVQSLLARGAYPEADLVVLDECHHHGMASEHWSTFARSYTSARHLGLTATPERADGTALGDIFDGLCIAASYSELIEAGHLAPCAVYRSAPDEARSGWALDPVVAYQRHAEGTRAFAFFDRVKRAEEWARNFDLAGIPARTISGNTKPDDRERWLDELAEGRVRVVCNVGVLTEGVDVPAATTCILARAVSHPSIYLQMVGRVLRPFAAKATAFLLDLVGASAQHGLPTDDRIYSLTGEAMASTRTASLSQCPACGAVYKTSPKCPMCGWLRPALPPPTIKIWNADLRRVFAGPDTPEPAKADELARLHELARRRGFGLGFVAREFEKLFGAPPSFADVDLDTRKREYDALRRVAIEKGFKAGFAAVRYKSIFGAWPPREWVSQ